MYVSMGIRPCPFIEFVGILHQNWWALDRDFEYTYRTVYMAGDPKLGRDAAIKAWPADFAKNPDRVAHFQREVTQGV